MSDLPTTELHPAEARFDFLFPGAGRPRYRLEPPDILELRWCVWDNELHCTLNFGTSPADAVDTAISIIQNRK